MGEEVGMRKVERLLLRGLIWYGILSPFVFVMLRVTGVYNFSNDFAVLSLLVVWGGILAAWLGFKR